MKLLTKNNLSACSIACSLLLSACGGGEDFSYENAAQTETASVVGTHAAAGQREYAAELKADGLSAMEMDIEDDAAEDWSIRIGPDDLAGESFPILDPLTFVNEQAAEPVPLDFAEMSAGATREFAAAAAGGPTVKWNPGHYVFFGSKAGDYVIDAALRETAGMPFVKGIVVRASWRQLEPRKGQYDFSRVERYLQKAAAKNKRLFVMLSTKTVNGDKAVPDYLRTAQYGGGAFRIGTIKGTQGENVALHNDNVRDRLIALSQALGRRYNKNNNFEGIMFNETAFGKMVKPLSEAQKQRFFSNLARVDTATRNAFPNSVVIQFMNYPANFMPALFENMKKNGVGMGGPDVFINDPNLNRSAYGFNPKATGTIPIGMKVETDSYDAVRHGGPYNPPDVRDIYRFGRDKLHANYLFWFRYTARHNPWADVLKMFKGEAFSSGSSGGLKNGCPSTFAKCTPKL
ncbi:beta-galactosidase [uncultured Azohydromonas sp.]|jgi:Beta-galactosidase.|uniref:beta-galactosidase n=1 Tax=uncultured Azohydromonas sp. TaxID=487342 RepID=UPI0026118AD0|nr:beta-galactosidase [uncultured Azohydromonas sp.]